MKYRILSILTICCALAAAVFAGTSPSDIAADSVWAAQIDMKAMRESEIGRSVMQTPEWQQFEADAAALKEVIGVDLAKDIHAATLYGPDYAEQNNVAIIRGQLDSEKIKDVLALSEGFKASEGDNVVVYSWVDRKKGKPVACAFHGTDTIIFSQDPQAVRKAVAVLDGRGRAMGHKGKIVMPKATFISFGATEHNGRIGKRQEARLGTQMTAVSLALGEEAGKIGIALKMTAKAEEAALQIEQIVTGFRALALMAEDVDPEARKFLQGISVARQGKALTLTAKGEGEALIKLIKDGRKNDGMRSNNRAR